jgi:hypothetical protein
MIKAKRGHVVTIASMAGLAATPGLSDYSASKFGAIAVDEALRLENYLHLPLLYQHRYVQWSQKCVSILHSSSSGSCRPYHRCDLIRGASSYNTLEG